MFYQSIGYTLNEIKKLTMNNYLVDHSSLIFLINEKDEYITHFSPKDFEDKFPNYIN